MVDESSDEDAIRQLREAPCPHSTRDACPVCKPLDPNGIAKFVDGGSVSLYGPEGWSDDGGYRYRCGHTRELTKDEKLIRDAALLSLSRIEEERDAALQALGRWRGWAQFVYGAGGPIDGDDDTLRRMVNTSHDREHAELRAGLKAAEAECSRMRESLEQIRDGKSDRAGHVNPWNIAAAALKGHD